MLLAEQTGHTVTSQGVNESEIFPIVNSAFMYNILSNGLYGDKIAAVIREPSCNAVDSHIMAGIPTQPIEVKLPNALSPTFYVKDWGVGLSDEEVRKIYTSYGKSTKRENEETTGAFGLGSKAPFAYTSEDTDNAGGFSVTAVKDGIRNVYTCYFNELGMPALSKLFTGPADPDWQHGVMVSFSVRTADISTFQKKAMEVFKWFTVKPTILGNTTSISGTNFYLETTEFGIGSSNEAAVIMGNVRYPLMLSSLREPTKVEQLLISNGIHLHLPMGTVLMTPSREALQYFANTMKVLRPYLAKVVKHLVSHLEQQHDQYLSNQSWEGKRIYLKEVELAQKAFNRKLADVLRAICVEYPQLLKGEQAEVLIRSFSPYMPLPLWIGHQTHDVAEVSIITEKVKRTVSNGFLFKRGKSTTEGEAALNAQQKCCVVFANSTHLGARIKEAFQKGDYSTLVVVKAVSPNKMEKALEIAEKLVNSKELKGISLVLSQDLPLPAKLEKQRVLQSERKKQREKKTPDSKPDGTVGFIFNSGQISYMPLSSVYFKGPLFYIVTKSQTVERGIFSNQQGKDCLAGELNLFSDIFFKMNRLCSFFEVPEFALITVASEAEAKRLQLVEQGITPYFFWVKDIFVKNKQKIEAFDKARSVLPSIPPHVGNYFEETLGIVGVIAWIEENAPAQFEKMSKMFKRTKTWHELLGILREMQILQSTKDKEASVLTDIQTICASISGPMPIYKGFRNIIATKTFLKDLMSVPMHSSLNYAFLNRQLQRTPELTYSLIEATIKQMHAGREKKRPLMY